MTATPVLTGIDHLYSDHQRWLQGWLRQRLGNECDAADLVQDVFIRLLTKPRTPSFESRPQARAYLSTIANGLCINLWHRRELEQAWLETLAAQPENTAPSPEHQAIVLETLREISQAIMALPGKGGQVFILAVIQGMTEVEVAQAVGLSTRMVRKYVAQGMLACMMLKAQYQAQQISPL